MLTRKKVVLAAAVAAASSLLLAARVLACEQCRHGKGPGQEQGAAAGHEHAAHHAGHGQAGAGTAGCPMHVQGTDVKVANTDSGVVITITAKDPEAVKKLQAAAAAMAAGHGDCPHCKHKAGKKGAAGQGSGQGSGQGAAPGKAPAKAQGKAAEPVYACPMNDYSGPNTKDGRCPKCGMSLELRK